MPKLTPFGSKSKSRKTARIPRGITEKVYRFVRGVDHGTISLSNAASTTGGKNFMLSDVPNSSEFSALFDVYRIAMVEFRLLFNANIIGVQSAVPFAPCRYATVIDYNSSSSLSSLNDAREFRTCEIKTFPFDAEVQRNIVPRFITVVEDSTSSVVAGGSETGWLNTAVPNVPHYGIRYFFEQLTSPYTGSLDLEARYHLEFKEVK